jgi:hypothetical protein
MHAVVERDDRRGRQARHTPGVATEAGTAAMARSLGRSVPVTRESDC